MRKCWQRFNDIRSCTSGERWLKLKGLAVTKIHNCGLQGGVKPQITSFGQIAQSQAVAAKLLWRAQLFIRDCEKNSLVKNLLLVFLLISSASFADWGDTKGNKSSDNARVAAVTCAVISESNPWQAAFRVERVNQAREKLGLKAYLDGDKKLMRAVANDTCELLVLDDPKYQDMPNGSEGFDPSNNDSYADFSRQIIDELLIHWKALRHQMIRLKRSLMFV